MFYHLSPTVARVAGNGGVRSLRDNVSFSPTRGRQSVSRSDDCQHHGGQGLGVNGRVNISELPLLTVVTFNERKMLHALQPKR